jgi:hypothetical protein
VSPSTTNTPAGTVATYAVTVTRTNFTGSINFSVTGTPPTSGVSFTPPSTTGNTTSLQVSTSAATTVGSYTLTITGTSGSTTASTVAQLTVSAAAHDNRAFTITGTLDRSLAPGVTGFLDLSITNPNNQPISITNLTVSLTGTSKPGCATSNFSVAQLSGAYPFTVPANSTRTLSQLGIAQSVRPRVTMIDLPVNQDVCKTTGLTLGYSGTGQGN